MYTMLIMKNFSTLHVRLISILLLGVAISGFYALKNPSIENPPLKEETKLSEVKKDVKNITYKVEGEAFVLVNGTASKEIAPGSATKSQLSIFGEPVYGDLNGDGLNDAAVTLAYNPGGSGTFYYAVLALATGTTFTTTNSLLLGDRIAPQSTTIASGRATYTYAIRKAGEAMTIPPLNWKKSHYSL